MAPTHALLTDRGNEPLLAHEVQRVFRHGDVRVLAPGLLTSNFCLQPEFPPILAFAKQVLPNASSERACSIHDWAERLVSAAAVLPDDQPWQWHVVPQYASGRGGENRCQLITETAAGLLRRQRRHFWRAHQSIPAAFQSTHSLIQLLLTAPDTGFLSVSRTPLPYQWRRIVSPFPKGEIPIASDKSAPSRAFAKLLEAEQRLGERIGPGESCVDLGASPGSWSYVALSRGARVTAVDRAPLRADLMSHPGLRFVKGDAFTFEPDRPVDWLLCDVIAAPERTVELLLGWVRKRRAARFVVTIKFKGTEDYVLLERLKYALPPLCAEFYLTRLSANKNEVCAFGVSGLRQPSYRSGALG